LPPDCALGRIRLSPGTYPAAARIPNSGKIFSELSLLVIIIAVGGPPSPQPLPELRPPPHLALLDGFLLVLGTVQGCVGGGIPGAVVAPIGLGKLLPNIIASRGGLGRPGAVALQSQDGDNVAGIKAVSGIGGIPGIPGSSAVIIGRGRIRRLLLACIILGRLLMR